MTAKVITHRGILWDLEKGVRSLKESFLAKIRRRSELFRAEPTMPRGRSLLGSFVFAESVLPDAEGHLIPFGHLMRWVAHACVNKSSPPDGATLHEVQTCMTRWYHSVTLDRPYRSPCALVAADASDWGWGGIILYPDAVVDTVSEKWDHGEERETIATRETRALGHTVARAGVPNVVAVCDNANTVSWVRHRRGPNSTIDSILDKFVHRIVDIRWIASQENPADNLSRGL